MQTRITTPVVEHLTNPNDLILNTTQMHDATHLQKFRMHSTALDEETVIQESVARAINQRKSAKAGSSGTGRGRGRGRRRHGVPHGSNLAIHNMGGSSGRARGGGRGRGMLSVDMAVGEGSSRQDGRRQDSLQPGELLLDFNYI